MSPQINPSSRRRIDDESGMGRTRPQGRTRADLEESSSESYASSDSELHEELEMPAKDDSRRPRRKKPQPPAKGRRDGRSKFIPGEEDDAEDLAEDKERETDSKVAPHVMLLLGSVYHLGLSSISRPSVSSFVPWFGNAFQMLHEMCFLVSDNTLLHEMCPEFFSVAMYLYYAHVYYYQILRARAAAGSDVLTRIEKRVLTYYERVGPPESWPIAAPMIGFIHGLGSHKPEDPVYSWIVPKLPDFSVLRSVSATDSLGHLHNLPGGQRIPIVPALQKLLYNFANEVATFDDGELLPLGRVDATGGNQFCGISSSASNSLSFQSLVWNTCWYPPTETGHEFGIIDFDVKRKRFKRWNIPDVPNNADLTSLQQFLGFQDGASFYWMNRLLSMASIFNRFFPGSTTLAEIPPTTTLGMATYVKYEKTRAPTAASDSWFQWNRDHLKISAIYGYSNTEAGLLDIRRAVAVSVRADLANSCVPSTGRSLDHQSEGPFFIDGTLPERHANYLVEAGTQLDPAQRFGELLAPYYDNKGGRA